MYAWFVSHLSIRKCPVNGFGPDFSMGWYNKHPTSYVSICQHPGCKCWPAISSSWFAEKIFISYGPLLNDSLWRPCLSLKCSHIGNVTHLLCLTTSLCFPHKEATVWFDAIVSARLYLMLPVVSLGTSNEVPLGSSQWWRSGAAGVGRGRWACLWRDSLENLRNCSRELLELWGQPLATSCVALGPWKMWSS